MNSQDEEDLMEVTEILQESDIINQSGSEDSLVGEYISTLNFYQVYYSQSDTDQKKLGLVDEYISLLTAEHDYLLEKGDCIKSKFFDCQESLKISDLQALDRSSPFPFKLLNGIACGISSTCILDQKLDITLDTQIGSGLIGQIYKGSIKNETIPQTEDLLVLKFSKGKGKIEKLYNIFDGIDLFHEIFVGISAINFIRRKIPNFIYTYGFIRCDKMLDCNGLQNNDGTVNDYPIPIIEYVSDSFPFRNVLGRNSYEEFISIFLQILLGLRMANENFGFVHFDLHTDNIMLSDLEDEDIFLYEGLGAGTNLEVRRIGYIPRIIDYGYARVDLDDMEFSARRIRFPLVDRLNFITDIYKLVGFIVLNFSEFNKKVDTILKIFFRMKDVVKEKYSGEKDYPFYEMYINILILNLVLPLFKDKEVNFIKNIIGNNIILFLYYKYLIDCNLSSKSDILKKVYYYTPTNLVEFQKWLWINKKDFRFTDKVIVVSENGVRSTDRTINYPRQELENSLDEIVDISLGMINTTFDTYNKFISEIIFKITDFAGYISVTA